MKFIFTLIAAGLVAAQTSFADMKIPRSVFTVDQLEEAQAKAIEKKRPIAYVLMNPGST